VAAHRAAALVSEGGGPTVIRCTRRAPATAADPAAAATAAYSSPGDAGEAAAGI